MRMNLSSSENAENYKSKLKLKNITCSSIRRLHGDAGVVEDAVQEGGEVLQGGSKEVTVQKFTEQRAGLGLGEQIGCNDGAAATSGRTGSGTVHFLYSKQV